jgi:uncharacterized protein YraI/lysophospholipase L1-like esterase
MRTACTARMLRTSLSVTVLWALVAASWPAQSPADVSQPVVHYNCPNGPAFGHYVPAGRHWGNVFTAQGATITDGSLLLGANADGNDHRATIGIYTGGPTPLSGELGAVTVPVNGYGGVTFTFPQPINVTAGQTLWIGATGVGDFTAYDQNNGGVDGCFIGRVNGFTPLPGGAPPPVPATPAPPSFRYAIANVSSPVSVRAGPSTSTARIGALPGNSPIDITCQTVGESINGSPIWDQLLTGGYVSDWYTTTPVVGDYSPGIPHCQGAPDEAHPSSPAGRWAIVASAPVNLRAGPGVGYNVVGTLSPGARFEIACQTYGSYYLGSPIWDRLPDGRYIHDYVTNTPVFANFSPGLAVCDGTGARPPAPSGSCGAFTNAGGITTGGAGVRADYVALGDSFSSGEGAPDAGLAGFSQSEQFHRSSLAYPVRFAGLVGAQLGPYFLAQSGAVTRALIGHDQLGQVPAGGARLVTLTIGGNDLGFPDIMDACVRRVDSCTSRYANVEQRIPAMRAVLRDAYRRVKDRAKGGRVVVVGYPRFFPTPGRWCTRAAGVSPGEQNWINDRIMQFDGVARAAAAQEGVEFVNPDGRAFIGHDACSSEAFINGVVVPFTMYSFHPNAAGHLAIAHALVDHGVR